MVVLSSGSPLGATISTSEIENLAVTDAKIANGTITASKLAGSITFSLLSGTSLSTGQYPPGWVLADTLTLSASTTDTTTSMSAYKEIALVITELLAVSGAAELSIRFNGVDTATYEYGTIDYNAATPVAYTAGATSGFIGGYGNSVPLYGTVYIKGKTPSVANGNLGYSVSCMGDLQAPMSVYGIWQGGNATQISTITIIASANSTGSIKVLGRSLA